MEKIKKRRYDLAGKVIYMEKSDCSEWKLVGYNDRGGYYDAVLLDDDWNETDQTGSFTPHDLIGNYIRG